MNKRAPTGPTRSVITSGNPGAVPIAPALDDTMDNARITRKRVPTMLVHRVIWISLLAIVLGIAAAEIAQLLMFMINIITDITFYGRVSDVVGASAKHSGSFVLSPANHTLGLWVILMPVIGGLIAGIMPRWGSRAIHGHGIPEALDQILHPASNTHPRTTRPTPVY